MARRGMDRNHHRFGGRRVVFVGDTVDGDEDVGFGERGGHAGAGYGVFYLP